MRSEEYRIARNSLHDRPATLPVICIYGSSVAAGTSFREHRASQHLHETYSAWSTSHAFSQRTHQHQRQEQRVQPYLAPIFGGLLVLTPGI